MKDSNSDLGRYLRELRKNLNQTLHQVAKSTDIDSPMLSKIERGERMPTPSQLKKISKHYKVPESELQVLLTAEKIIRDYGINDTTYEAIKIVEEHLIIYNQGKRRKS